MRCEQCHGLGRWPVIRKTSISVLPALADKTPLDAQEMINNVWSVCKECNGSGIAHCCDGMVEQPDGPEDQAL